MFIDKEINRIIRKFSRNMNRKAKDEFDSLLNRRALMTLGIARAYANISNGDVNDKHITKVDQFLNEMDNKQTKLVREIADKHFFSNTIKEQDYEEFSYILTNVTKGKFLEDLTILPKTEEIKDSKQIFIVHGHDTNMQQMVARLLEQQNITPIFLRNRPTVGTRAILNKIERYSDVSAAIILLSPDDFGYLEAKGAETKKYRPRMNVIFEFGYFFSHLGEDYVIPVFKKTENFEFPTDLEGIGYIDSTDGEWPYKLLDELAAIGFIIDKNKVEI